MTTRRGRRTAATLAAALLLGVAGCGSATDGDATSSGSASGQATGDPGSASPAPPEEAVVVAILTGTVAGGRVDPTPMPLSTPEEVQAFVASFTNREFVRRVERAVADADVAEGRTLVGAVVTIGCEVPDDVEVVGPPGAIRITPVLPAKATPRECFAPMTSVGLVDVPDALLEPADAG